jgi:tRNA(fMet)-specific endonuclease VapC
MLRFLLDTNIVIYVLKRRPIEVLSVFNANASRGDLISGSERRVSARGLTRIHSNLLEPARTIP